MNSEKRGVAGIMLVVVPCGRAKIWQKHSDAGPTSAELTYTGAPLKVNREFAKTKGDHWVILSAKYGFIEPGFLIPEDYNVSFKDRRSHPVNIHTLQQQVRAAKYDRFDHVIALGGREYTSKVRAAFDGTSVIVQTPVEGLPIGKMMSKVKELTRMSTDDRALYRS